MNRYASEEEIENVVRGFETCATGKEEFRHPQHLTVAVWYLHTMDRDAALDRMRSGLLRFIDHHGVDKGKYSESVTVYWIDQIAGELEGLGPDVSLLEKCNTVLAADFRR